MKVVHGIAPILDLPSVASAASAISSEQDSLRLASLAFATLRWLLH
jgi:hypothetical protein